ncbi:MAG: toprim domain-containing protein [Phycisphaerae bacterium]
MGLFVPFDVVTDEHLIICEGATDTAAVYELGCHVIGRPGCNQARQLAVRFVKRHRCKTVVVVADRDPPGLAGAKRLAKALALHCADVRIVAPPKGVKDVREWVQRGLTTAKLRSAIRSAKPVIITVSCQGK